MGLLDQFKAYIDANTPRNTRPAVSPQNVIYAGLLQQPIENIKANAAGLLGEIQRAPQDLAALASPQMYAQALKAMNTPKPVDKQKWLDAGMELSGMAPVGGLLGMAKGAGLSGIADNAGMGDAKHKLIKLYRGEYSGNKGGNYWTPDIEDARQYTQSGLDDEILRGAVHSSVIKDVSDTVYAGDPDAIEKAMKEAIKDGYEGLLLDEGAGVPKSYYIFDRKSIHKK